MSLNSNLIVYFSSIWTKKAFHEVIWMLQRGKQRPATRGFAWGIQTRPREQPQSVGQVVSDDDLTRNLEYVWLDGMEWDEMGKEMGMGKKYVWYALWNRNTHSLGNGHSIKWWNLHSIIKPMEWSISSFMDWTFYIIIRNSFHIFQNCPYFNT